MAGIISDNPQQTSGRAKLGQKTLSYPVSEVLSSSTRLRFVEYNRFSPSDTNSENTTAIINLPMPTIVPENYSFDIGTHQLGNYGNINNSNWDKIQQIDKNTDWANADSILKFGQAAATESIKSRQFNVMSALGGIGAAFGSSDLSTTIQSFTGVIKNPHTTIVFNGVNLRAINLEWRMSAKHTNRTQNKPNTRLSIMPM